jgi:hypothetical protein
LQTHRHSAAKPQPKERGIYSAWGNGCSPRAE